MPTVLAEQQLVQRTLQARLIQLKRQPEAFTTHVTCLCQLSHWQLQGTW